MAGFTLQAPVISQVCYVHLTSFHILTPWQAELNSFHDAHFGQVGTDHFSTDFLPQHDRQHVERASDFQQEDVFEEEDQEDDGLGYYEDGAKRTLTDEQIAMFRHSEMQALRRAEEDAAASGHATSIVTPSSNKAAHQEQASEPGELPSEDDIPSETKAAGKKKKRRRAKGRIEPEKPDLRKRTWDVVDSGLASLDYGDEPESSTVSRPTQRRHITYDD